MADAIFSQDFEKPPAEVTRYLREKGIKPSFSWRDVWLDEHAFSFTVAKSAGYDILSEVKGALEKAIDERQDFDAFRKGLEPLLKSKGWWGRARATDPLTGEEKIVTLGSPGRLRVIYWANVQGAYAAGEWERIWRTRRVLPYLEYLVSTSIEKRPEHLAQVGVVLPVEDPFWDTWYPPSDWGCMCRVRQLSKSAAQKRPDFGKPPADFGMRDFVNTRTGEVKRIPNGVSPDWANNPGKARGRSLADFIAGKIDAMEDDARRIASADLVGSHLFRLIASTGARSAPGQPLAETRGFNFDAASTLPEMLARGDIALPAAALPADKAALLDTKARAVRLSVRDASEIAARSGQAQPLASDYALVQRILDEGRLNNGVVTATIDGATWTLRLRVEKHAVYIEGLSKAD